MKMIWMMTLSIAAVLQPFEALRAQCGPAPLSLPYKNSQMTGEDVAAMCKSAGPFAERYCASIGQALLRTNPKSVSDAKAVLDAPLLDSTKFVCAMARSITDQKLATDLSSKGREAIGSAVSTLAATAQNGANGQSGGATNLVSKPTTTDFISVAAESGAFATTSNSSSLTITANAEGLRRYLASEAMFSPGGGDILRHISMKATFNVSQAASTKTASTTPANGSTPPSISSVLIPVSNNLTFNSFTASYSLKRKGDPRNPTFQENWISELKKDAALIPDLKSLGSDIALLEAHASEIYASPTVAAAKVALDASFPAKQAADITKADFQLVAANFKSLAEAVETQAALTDTAFRGNAFKALQAEYAVGDELSTILDSARGNLLTAQYSYSVQPNKPGTNDATIAYAYTAKSGFQTNLNAYASWYASLPKGATYQQLRACQFSGELDKPLGPKTAPSATASLAAYGQYQYDKTVLNITSGNLVPGTNIPLPSNAQVLLGTTGWTGIAQAKVVFNIPKAKGMSIPVAAKWSNQTDLQKGGDWRGQFGISYDLSALSSLLAPAK